MSLVKIDTQTIQRLNEEVSSVLTSKQMQAFDKAFAMAGAIQTLRELLTEEIMKPIMSWQGSQLGFKSDKDKTGGYPLDVVRDCLITAVLQGFMPTGNQFNIIAGNCYITKEGFEYRLPLVQGLVYSVTHELPRIQGEKAGVVMNIEWSMNGEPTRKKSIDFPIKVNAYSSADAVIGKGKRKAYAWLYSHVTGINLPEGEVEDQNARVVYSKTNTDHEYERAKVLIGDATTLEELNKVTSTMGDDIIERLEFEIMEAREKLSSNEDPK